MILFVFEGEKREPELFRSIETLFFRNKQNIVCSFGNNIYELYRELSDYDGAGDLVSILREKYKGHVDSPFSEVVSSSDFSEIYLIFDFDFQNRNITLADMNQQVLEMLEIFDDETGNGKLYINYPMVEAIRYTKTLPDPEYNSYTVSREKCQNSSFKALADEFSDYNSLDFITLNPRRPATNKEIESRRLNWEILETQNVSKANLICNGTPTIPEDKQSISQHAIFRSQLASFIEPSETVSILSAFPLFLFDYFPATPIEIRKKLLLFIC